MIRRFLTGVALLAMGACNGGPGTGSELNGDEEPPPPRWHFDFVDHGIANATLTGIWARTDGAVFAVGWFGEIITNEISSRNTDGRWVRMVSPTFENLTSIIGVENGTQFGLPGPKGEMFAVGWAGTILHYHPNPDDDPDTDDGVWGIISAPEGARFSAVEKVDPSCPDRDGDGIGDDGDGSGWAGDAYCMGGARAGCDDNCIGAANGPDRPIVDAQPSNSCIGPEDSPDPSQSQVDGDSDGIGAACDDLLEQEQQQRDPFVAPLFDVWAEANGDQVLVVAVGGNGAMVTGAGPSAGVPAPTTPAIDDTSAWITQDSTSFYFSDDCFLGGAAAGEACPGSSHLPPSCPAMCYPAKSSCAAPCDQEQCCDAGGSTGAGCSDGSCGAAATACQGDGTCNALCPTCFRRLAETLRSVWGTANHITAVGARGTIVTLPRSDAEFPNGVYRTPVCVGGAPPPLDERPVLSAVGGRDDNFVVVGAAGGAFGFNAAGGACGLSGVTNAPPAFLAGFYARGGNRGYAVGDRGLLLDINGGNATVIDTTLEATETPLRENLTNIWVSRVPGTGDERIWLIGASGVMIQGDWF